VARRLIKELPPRVAFSFASLLGIVGYYLWLENNIMGQLIVFAALLIMTGLPHGAIDPALARRAGLWSGAAGLLAFSLTYFSASVALLGLWFLQPELLVIPLLVLSAWHFSGDWLAHFRKTVSVAISIAVITLPALFHAEAVTEIFDLLVRQSGPIIVYCMGCLAAASSLYVFVCCIIKPRPRATALLELLVLFGSALVLPPIPYFTLYFCLLHSPLHLRDSLLELGTTETLTYAIPFTVLSIAAGFLFWVNLPAVELSAQIIQVIFIGLFALTVPHMVLIELLKSKAT
jgi:Brp/Blh family beta-carotene 15,15'-monooxygenase